MHSASDFRQATIFRSGVPLDSHLASFYYAPPDTWVASLMLVALEQLLSIEGATEIQMGCSFSRVHGFPYEGKLSAARLTDEVDNVT